MYVCVSCKKHDKPSRMAYIRGDLVCARCIIDKKMIRQGVL